MRALRAVFVGLAAAAALSGCEAFDTARSCTDIGTGPSSVTFDVSRVLAANPQSLDLHACVGSRCVSRHVSASPRFWDGTQWTVVNGAMSEETLPVLLTVRGSGGSEVFDGVLDVEPQIEQVNGPGCPPTVWRASVVADGDNSLRQDTEQAG